MAATEYLFEKAAISSGIFKLLCTGDQMLRQYSVSQYLISVRQLRLERVVRANGSSIQISIIDDSSKSNDHDSNLNHNSSSSSSS